MTRNLRADMADDQFRRFKEIKASMVGAQNNDEVIVNLMDCWEENND